MSIAEQETIIVRPSDSQKNKNGLERIIAQQILFGCKFDAPTSTVDELHFEPAEQNSEVILLDGQEILSFAAQAALILLTP